MLHRRVEYLLLCPGNFERAIFLTGVIPAINGFPLRRHCKLQVN
jgi:hypothetical protein